MKCITTTPQRQVLLNSQITNLTIFPHIRIIWGSNRVVTLKISLTVLIRAVLTSRKTWKGKTRETIFKLDSIFNKIMLENSLLLPLKLEEVWMNLLDKLMKFSSLSSFLSKIRIQVMKRLKRRFLNGKLMENRKSLEEIVWWKEKIVLVILKSLIIWSLRSTPLKSLEMMN